MLPIKPSPELYVALALPYLILGGLLAAAVALVIFAVRWVMRDD